MVDPMSLANGTRDSKVPSSRSGPSSGERPSLCQSQDELGEYPHCLKYRLKIVPRLHLRWHDGQVAEGRSRVDNLEVRHDLMLDEL
eukprot:1580053-Pyramimonas_sp.AAC.1